MACLFSFLTTALPSSPLPEIEFFFKKSMNNEKLQDGSKLLELAKQNTQCYIHSPDGDQSIFK